MKKILILTFALLTFITAKAQQDAMFTHYSFNTLAVNPAYAGSRDALTVTTLYRRQWVGFDGAPITQTLTAHSPLLNDKLGVGLSVLNDKIGPIRTTAGYIDFVYKIKLGETAKLAFGLKAGLNVMQSSLNVVRIDQVNDDAFSNSVQSNLLPNFGFGLYYYVPQFYVGLSIPKLVENDFQKNTVVGGTKLASEKRHYYAIAGTIIELNPSFKFRPTTFVKITAAAPIEADVTAMFIVQDKLEVGLMFRTGDALGALLGYNINERFRVGYSFDWSYSNTTIKYNSGSHEIMLRYDFIYRDKAKVRSPRFF